MASFILYVNCLSTTAADLANVMLLSCSVLNSIRACDLFATFKLPSKLKEIGVWVSSGTVCGDLTFFWSLIFLLEAHVLLKFWPSSPWLVSLFSHTKILVTLKVYWVRSFVEAEFYTWSYSSISAPMNFKEQCLLLVPFVSFTNSFRLLLLYMSLSHIFSSLKLPFVIFVGWYYG